MKKFWTIVRYVVGGFFALGAVVEVLDYNLRGSWTVERVFDVCVGVLIGYACLRPLLPKEKKLETFARYMVGSYFALAFAGGATFHTRVDGWTWYALGIVCAQFSIASACFLPELARWAARARAPVSATSRPHTLPDQSAPPSTGFPDKPGSERLP